MNLPPGRAGRWGADLFAVVALAALSAVALLSPLRGSPVALLLGVPFLLFVPGYAVVAALFPEQPTDRGSFNSRGGSPDWLVRAALSLLVSALVVALVGLVLGWLLTISLLPLIAAIAAITVCGVAVAGERRRRLPAGRRADPLGGRSLTLLPGGTSLQSVTLGIALVALLGATVFVGVTPVQGEQYSEASLLTENADGERVAEGYPSTFVAGEGHELSVALSNHEGESLAYEVVVVAQQVGSGGEVTAEQRVDRFGTTLDHGETAVLERQIAPTMTGEDVRLRFLVYEGTTPGGGVEPDQTLQLWIDVESGA